MNVPTHVSRHEGRAEKAIAKGRDWNSAEIVGRSVTVNRNRDDLYAWWRNLPNLARAMENVESIALLANGNSRWRVKGPGDDSIEFESRITQDVPGECIGWETVDGDVKHTGRVEFSDAPGGRGALVRLVLAYEPPAGGVGKLIAKMFQREPAIQAAQDLRRFKQLMETGEIPTSEPGAAAPRPN